MKALVAFLCVAVESSTHVLEKRSLRRVGQLERTGRYSPASATAGYLPPAEDDYVDYDDDSAGFGTGKGDSTGKDVRGFGQQGQDNDNQQSQYGQKDRSGTLGNSVAGHSSNKRNQPEGNQIVKFGQHRNKNSQNTGLTGQQGARRNQQGGGRNQQKTQRQNQFDLDKEQDGTYDNEVDKEQILNHQQQGGPGSQTRQGNNQRSQGNNSKFDNLKDFNDKIQYGQQSGRNNGGQFGQQGHQNQNRQVGGQTNQQQGQGISGQRENIQFLQGQAKALLDTYGGQGNSQTLSLQFGQGRKNQQQRQGQEDNFGNHQNQSADDSYGAPGTEQGNIKSQNGQDQRGQNQGRQDQQGENQTGQNQRRLDQRGQNNRGKNQRRQTQRGQDQRGHNASGQNQRGQFQEGQNQEGFSNGNDLGNQQIQGETVKDRYGAPGQGQDNNKSQIGHQMGQIQMEDQLRGQNQVGFIKGNSIGDQQVQDQSADESYGAPGQGSENNKFKQNQNIQNQRACPGGTVETCIKVCPGNTAKLYGGCVQGCADRCADQGQGAPFGQQGNSGQSAQFGQQGNSGQDAQFGQQGNPGQGGQFGQQGYSDQAAQFVQQGNTRQSTQLGQNGEGQQGQYDHHND